MGLKVRFVASRVCASNKIVAPSADLIRGFRVENCKIFDRLTVGWLNGWEGYHESRRCLRETYPESYIEVEGAVRCEPRLRL